MGDFASTNWTGPPDNPSLPELATAFSKQVEKLSHEPPSGDASHPDLAVEARFVTPQDPVIVTSAGNRLPGVPLKEAHKLNALKEEVEGSPHTVPSLSGEENSRDGHLSGTLAHDSGTSLPKVKTKFSSKRQNGTLRRQIPPSHTNPLFPPLPLYGPPSPLRTVQYTIFRISSFVLSLAFLSVIVLGALFTSIPHYIQRVYRLLTFRRIDEHRPSLEEEKSRKRIRKATERAWRKRDELQGNQNGNSEKSTEKYPPTEGGPDPVVCDPAYYARRVGLDLEEFQVETEDGFILDLWHVYDPKVCLLLQ